MLAAVPTTSSPLLWMRDRTGEAGAVAAARLTEMRGYGGAPLVATIAALFLLLLPYFLLGTTRLSARIGAWMEARPSRTLALVGLPVLPYLLYASGTGTFSWISLVKLVAFVVLPLVLLLWARRSGPPPRVPDALAREVERVALAAYHALGCRDWCRIDVRLDARGVPNVVELNPLPGILPDPRLNSCFPKAARAAGYSYDGLIQEVVRVAWRRITGQEVAARAGAAAPRFALRAPHYA